MDIVIGSVIVVLALVLVSGLTFFSRRTIARIAERGSVSARDFKKGM